MVDLVVDPFATWNFKKITCRIGGLQLWAPSVSRPKPTFNLQSNCIVPSPPHPTFTQWLNMHFFVILGMKI